MMMSVTSIETDNRRKALLVTILSYLFLLLLFFSYDSTVRLLRKPMRLTSLKLIWAMS